MSNWRQPDWAIEAIARHFSAKWEGRNGTSSTAYLTMSRKRIGLDIVVIAPRKTATNAPSKPRLRFDRVALGLIRRLQTGLAESVPAGQTVVITVTAPIRLASRTAVEMAETIRQCLGRRSARLEIDETMNGNRIRARLMKDVSRRASKVAGYVHNPAPDPQILFDITESLLRHTGAAVRKRTVGKFAGDRWLALVCGEGGYPYSETYQQVFSQLAIPTGFDRVLLVLPTGRVAILSG